MSQHDFVIDNQSFPATRTDLNAAILAVASNSSGATAPTTTYANQFWYDTSTNILYIRNEANDGWVSVITLDASMTSSASELNKLTGATLTTAELNKLTGATLTTAELNKLTGATVTTTEINQLDAITRGSILYGNASGATARLAKGAADTVLTSDGTDISWAAAGGTGYPAQAWVAFRGTSTVLILDDDNVSSISDYGAGYYGENFSSALASTNYCATGDAQTNDGNSGRGRHEPQGTYTTSQVRVWTNSIQNVSAQRDSPRVMTTVTL